MRARTAPAVPGAIRSPIVKDPSSSRPSWIDADVNVDHEQIAVTAKIPALHARPYVNRIGLSDWNGIGQLDVSPNLLRRPPVKRRVTSHLVVPMAVVPELPLHRSQVAPLLGVGRFGRKQKKCQDELRSFAAASLTSE